MEYLTLLTGLGGLLVFMALGNLTLILLRNNWPTTDAKVLSYKIVTDHKIENPSAVVGGYSVFSLPKIRKQKFHQLKYVFVVGDYKYENEKIHSSPITFHANRRPLALKVGDYLKVSYCPSNPHLAYLLSSPLWPSVLVAALGIGLILLEFL